MTVCAYSFKKYRYLFFSKIIFEFFLSKLIVLPWIWIQIGPKSWWIRIQIQCIWIHNNCYVIHPLICIFFFPNKTVKAGKICHSSVLRNRSRSKELLVNLALFTRSWLSIYILKLIKYINMFWWSKNVIFLLPRGEKIIHKIILKFFDFYRYLIFWIYCRSRQKKVSLYNTRCGRSEPGLSSFFWDDPRRSMLEPGEDCWALWRVLSYHLTALCL